MSTEIQPYTESADPKILEVIQHMIAMVPAGRAVLLHEARKIAKEYPYAMCTVHSLDEARTRRGAASPPAKPGLPAPADGAGI